MTKMVNIKISGNKIKFPDSTHQDNQKIKELWWYKVHSREPENNGVETTRGPNIAVSGQPRESENNGAGEYVLCSNRVQ
jgi:hypothetical protein